MDGQRAPKRAAEDAQLWRRPTNRETTRRPMTFTVPQMKAMSPIPNILKSTPMKKKEPSPMPKVAEDVLALNVSDAAPRSATRSSPAKSKVATPSAPSAAPTPSSGQGRYLPTGRTGQLVSTKSGAKVTAASTATTANKSKVAASANTSLNTSAASAAGSNAKPKPATSSSVAASTKASPAVTKTTKSPAASAKAAAEKAKGKAGGKGKAKAGSKHSLDDDSDAELDDSRDVDFEEGYVMKLHSFSSRKRLASSVNELDVALSEADNVIEQALREAVSKSAKNALIDLKSEFTTGMLDMIELLQEHYLLQTAVRSANSKQRALRKQLLAAQQARTSLQRRLQELQKAYHTSERVRKSTESAHEFLTILEALQDRASSWSAKPSYQLRSNLAAKAHSLEAFLVAGASLQSACGTLSSFTKALQAH